MLSGPARAGSLRQRLALAHQLRAARVRAHLRVDEALVGGHGPVGAQHALGREGEDAPRVDLLHDGPVLSIHHEDDVLPGLIVRVGDGQAGAGGGALRVGQHRDARAQARRLDAAARAGDDQAHQGDGHPASHDAGLVLEEPVLLAEVLHHLLEDGDGVEHRVGSLGGHALADLEFRPLLFGLSGPGGTHHPGPAGVCPRAGRARGGTGWGLPGGTAAFRHLSTVTHRSRSVEARTARWLLCLDLLQRPGGLHVVRLDLQHLEQPLLGLGSGGAAALGRPGAQRLLGEQQSQAQGEFEVLGILLHHAQQFLLGGGIVPLQLVHQRQLSPGGHRIRLKPGEDLERFTGGRQLPPVQVQIAQAEPGGIQQGVELHGLRVGLPGRVRALAGQVQLSQVEVVLAVPGSPLDGLLELVHGPARVVQPLIGQPQQRMDHREVRVALEQLLEGQDGLLGDVQLLEELDALLELALGRLGKAHERVGDLVHQRPCGGDLRGGRGGPHHGIQGGHRPRSVPGAEQRLGERKADRGLARGQFGGAPQGAQGGGVLLGFQVGDAQPVMELGLGGGQGDGPLEGRHRGGARIRGP
ncbi:hypothetical protein STIAU_5173 [Stigmatella aurantiaca DW4/3-1]|uniref:Uncharacterized protein n=1 Tax=Stigmatella aurantiaca (strain DW4/3-1) TaxID=378806 RepID=Q08ZG8_STIAD|nr:hypothetical protein STIAU_5173 [Stigmatella aurantiaca DW4/3-1]